MKLLTDKILEVAKKLVKPTTTSKMGQLLFFLFGPDSEPVMPCSFVEVEGSTEDDSKAEPQEEEPVRPAEGASQEMAVVLESEVQVSGVVP